MKLKQRPEDFQVEELTAVQPTEEGPFALYRLEKQGWATHDALNAIRRRWQIHESRLSYGGLKDRHAATAQYFTIRQGPRRGLQQQGIVLKYLGQLPHPYGSRDITANRFTVTLRSLSADEAAAALPRLEAVQREGVPNYFDDQRFGSVAPDGASPARSLVLCHWEEALQLALMAPWEHDRAEQKREKAILRQHWNDWPTCKEQLPRSHARSLVDYLVSHPTDFRGAAQRLRPDLLSLYLSAYQSFLWNRLLASWLQQQCRPEQLFAVALRLGPVPMYQNLDADQQRTLAALQLPLPSARLRLEEGDPLQPLLTAAFADQQLTWSEMKLKGIRKPFFSRGERPALCLPERLSWEHGPDEHQTGRDKLVLRFDLQKGSYATLIVKRITTPAV